MPRLDQLRLAPKLLLPTLLSLLAFGGVYAVVERYGAENLASLEAVERRHVPGLLLARDLTEGLEAYQRALRAAADASDPDLLETADARRVEVVERLKAATTARTITGGESEALSKGFSAYVVRAQATTSALVEGRPDADLEAFAAEYRSFKGTLEKFREDNESRMAAAFTAAREAQAGSTRSIGFVILFAMLAVGGLSLALARAIARPVGRLTEAAQQVAGGDLTVAIEVSGSDEVAQLARAFVTMIERLRRHQGELHGAVEELRALSLQLASLSQQQEDGATRQASSVHETSVTLEELRHASQVAADRATRVREVAEKAQKIGEYGSSRVEAGRAGLQEIRQRVAEMVTSIDVSVKGARELKTIVETVRELADQSNMVALNAAIETAQAGMTTMRPVAREMRQLADQSAEETRRITDRLGQHGESLESVAERSKAGMQVVTEGLADLDDTSTALRDIVAVVHESSAAAVEIAGGVRQQHAAIGQISVAMSDLRGAVDASVTGVGELRRVASDLRGRSERLEKLVAEFKR